MTVAKLANAWRIKHDLTITTIQLLLFSCLDYLFSLGELHVDPVEEFTELSGAKWPEPQKSLSGPAPELLDAWKKRDNERPPHPCLVDHVVALKQCHMMIHDDNLSVEFAHRSI